MKMMFGGIKQSFWIWGFLNCPALRFCLNWSLTLKTKSCLFWYSNDFSYEFPYEWKKNVDLNVHIKVNMIVYLYVYMNGHMNNDMSIFIKFILSHQVRCVPKKRGISKCHSVCFTAQLMLNSEFSILIHFKIEINMFLSRTEPFLSDIREPRNKFVKNPIWH